MFFYNKNFLGLYICTVACCFSFVFTKLPYLYLIFFDFKSHIKQKSIALLSLLSLLTISWLIPKSLESYTLVGLYLSCAILLWLSIRNIVLRQQSMGEILFTSQYLLRTVYGIIPLSVVFIWSGTRIYQEIIRQNISSTINILGTEVNSFLWLGCCSLILVSAIVYGYFISWNKLTIRDKGIGGISEIYWHQVVDYSFLEKEKYSYLIIKHLNGFKREIETKYRIGLLEKDRVKQIFQDKLSK